MMSFQSIDAWWWPYLFITLAGFLPTDIWRWAGVALGTRLDETSPAMVLVRAIATALVAAVIGNLVVFPQGALAAVPLAGRMIAALGGFSAYLVTGRKVIIGILVAEGLLFAAMAFVRVYPA